MPLAANLSHSVCTFQANRLGSACIQAEDSRSTRSNSQTTPTKTTGDVATPSHLYLPCNCLTSCCTCANNNTADRSAATPGNTWQSLNSLDVQHRHEGLHTEINDLLLTMVFVPRIINHNLRPVLFELEPHLGLHLCFCLRL